MSSNENTPLHPSSPFRLHRHGPNHVRRHGQRRHADNYQYQYFNISMKILNILSYCLLSISCFGQVINITNVTIGTLTVLNSGSNGGSWVPTDNATLVIWQKADGTVTNSLGSTPPSNGDSVSTWADESGNKYHSVNSGNYPTWQSNVKNGLPIIRFTGASDQYLLANAAAGNLGGDDVPFTFFAVLKTASTGHTYPIFEHINPGGSTKYQTVILNSSDVYFYQRWDGSVAKSASGGTGVGDWLTLIVQSTGTTATLYTNGVVCGTTDQDVNVGALTDTTTVYLGRNDGGSYFDGDIGEWGVFTNAAVSVNSIQTYLKGRWATP